MDETGLLSINQHVADGVTTTWEISFAGGYLSREHVAVYVYDDETLAVGSQPTFSFVNDYTIAIVPAVASGKIIRIYRSTPADSPLVDFSDGSVVNERTLDLNAKQAVFIAAELQDRIGSARNLDEIGPLVQQALAAAGSAILAASNVLALAKSFDDRDLMAAYPLRTPGMSVQLKEKYGTSTWDYFNGAPPAPDPLRGLYVPAGTGHWRRRWNGIEGQPEWFGAVVDDATVNNLGALNACLALCDVVKLQKRDYYISDTWVINRPFVRVSGTGMAWGGGGEGTRIIQTNMAKNVIQIGSPTGFRADGMTVEGITARWNGDPVAPDLEPWNAPRAWDIHSGWGGTFRHLSTFDCITGFVIHGTTYCTLHDIRIYRSKSFRANDMFRGIWVRGIPRMTGMAGGNASITIDKVLVAFARGPQGQFLDINDPVALYIDGAFADTFVHKFESAGCANGIRVDGGGNDFDGGHGDCHFWDCIIDQLTGKGIEVRNLWPLAKIQFNGGYIQNVPGSPISMGMHLHGGNGEITVDSMQFVGSGAGTLGIRLDGQPNVSIGSSVIVENYAFPMDVINGCTRADVTCQLQAGMYNSGGNNAALTIDNCTESYFRPTIAGPAGAFVTAVNINGTGNSRIEVNLTKVDPGAVAGGGIRKMTINGIVVGNPGYYDPTGTVNAGAYAGILASGIVK